MRMYPRHHLAISLAAIVLFLCNSLWSECVPQDVSGAELNDCVGACDWAVAVKAACTALSLGDQKRGELQLESSGLLSLRLLFGTVDSLDGKECGARVVDVFEETCGIDLPVRTRDRLLLSKCSEGKIELDVSDVLSTYQNVACNEWTVAIGSYGQRGSNHLTLRRDGGIDARIEWDDFLDPTTSLSMATDKDNAFITAYSNGSQPFSVILWNRKVGRVMWSSTCRGGDCLAVVMGHSPVCVDIRVEGDEVRVFGVGTNVFFAEAFDVENGRARWRFCTKIANDARTLSGSGRTPDESPQPESK